MIEVIIEFRYVVLRGRFCETQHLDLFEKAFAFWFESWRKVFRQLNVERGPRADDFFRQDFVPVLLHNEQVVAIHHSTLYDLRSPSTRMHSYLQHNFNLEYFEALQKRKLNKVLSFESLFVAEEFRKSHLGVRMGEIIISLGQQVFKNYTDADAIIAPARADIKVAQTACALGFETLQAGVSLNNVTVDLLICEKEKIVPPRDVESRRYVTYLWRNQDLGTIAPLKSA